jgi:diamine N-acetyltransferase
MKIQLVTLIDIPVIQQIANKTWPIAYSEIISNEQLVYMLDLIYSDAALTAAINKKAQLFYIAKDENDAVLGFFAVEHNYNEEAKTKLHKIYILPENQGKGIGKLLMDEAINLSKVQKSNALILNVNRFNSAFYFYQKLGFEIIETVDIEIGNGYLMEDFVLKMKIVNK